MKMIGLKRDGGIGPFVVVLAMITVSSVCHAELRGKGGANKAVGGYFGPGLSFVAGEGYEESNGLNNDDRAGKFSMATGGYFDYYFSNTVGLEVGIGFLGNGIRFEDGDAELYSRIFYMELPILAKFDIHNFRLGAGLALWFALAGSTKLEAGNFSEEIEWDEDQWQYVHRVNLGPLLYAGFAIPAGPLFIVPSISFRMHLINDLNKEEISDDNPLLDEDELQMRFINLHFNFAVEYAF